VKYVLIKYRFQNGSKEQWHEDVVRFCREVESDPELCGKITYRAMRANDDDYYHLATAVDQAAADLLGDRDYFDRYTARTGEVSRGTVEVIPLEIVAETKPT
jgi:hypothetical protein